MTHRIQFKVATVSSTTNSFGLRGHILVSREGVAYQLGLNYLNELKKGAEVEVVVVTGDARPGSITNVREESEEKPTHEQVMSALTRKLSGEIPELVDANVPKAVMREIWNRGATSK